LLDSLLQENKFSYVTSQWAEIDDLKHFKLSQ